MKRISVLSLVWLLLSAGVFLSPTLRAADVYITVTFYNLDPDPVYISPGDSVYWVDGDDLGPYMISGDWGAIFTPQGLQFNVPPGAYSYSAASPYGGGSWNGTVVVSGADSPPTVTITNPTNNATYTAPANFSFEADASDPDPNDLSDVEFWVNDAMVDDVFAPPFSTSVTNLPAGTYTLTAIAWDNSFESATNSITITVVNGGPILLKGSGVANGSFVFEADGLAAGSTNVLEGSTNMVNWTPLLTNQPGATSLMFTNATTSRCQFFRVMQIQ